MAETNADFGLGRKPAENEVQQEVQQMGETERLLAQVLDALPVGVAVVDMLGNVIHSNVASKRVWGGMITSGNERYARAKAWWHETGNRIEPHEWASVRACMTGQTSVNEVIDIETFDGARKVIKNSAAPIHTDGIGVTGAVVINEDVTDFMRLEAEFLQAQKMEAIGHLAGGVAHDFNNLLTIINCYSNIVQNQLPAESPLRPLTLEIGQAGERAASLTHQILSFSRRQSIEPKVVNLNSIVTDTTNMLKRLIGEDIDLCTVLEPKLGSVRVDPAQMEQLLVNLAVNGRDAMLQGGKLTVQTRNVQFDNHSNAMDIEGQRELFASPCVLLSVSDTGNGFDDAIKARIFEPFFTTKIPGKGTGLGLATVDRIVKQNGGHITVDSEPGQGATFKVYLPLVEEDISSDPSPSSANAGQRGNETILLAEDDPLVRAVARHALQMHGYTVLTAGQGDKALRIAEDHNGPIHLLLTDVVMPVMSGRELAQRLCGIRPGVMILYLSGYTDDVVIQHGVLRADTAFLEKPFTPDSLAAKVREVLDQ